MTTASSDNWQVTPGGSVQCDHAVLYAEARQRVLHSRRLSVFLPIILSDGYADDADHLLWVVRGKVAEIERWARRIRSDSE